MRWNILFLITITINPKPSCLLPEFLLRRISINEELEKMRMSTTASCSSRRDILVVASVSCLYGIGNPVEFQKNLIPIEKGQIISRTKLLHQLVQSLYSRTEADFNPNFRIKETQ
jgi:excinuclease ABC subunit B